MEPSAHRRYWEQESGCDPQGSDCGWEAGGGAEPWVPPTPELKSLGAEENEKGRPAQPHRVSLGTQSAWATGRVRWWRLRQCSPARPPGWHCLNPTEGPGALRRGHALRRPSHRGTHLSRVVTRAGVNREDRSCQGEGETGKQSPSIKGARGGRRGKSHRSTPAATPATQLSDRVTGDNENAGAFFELLSLF